MTHAVLWPAAVVSPRLIPAQPRRAGGGVDAHSIDDRVDDKERPEVFFKATSERVVPDGEDDIVTVGIDAVGPSANPVVVVCR